jgi:hypothetical protein
MIRLILKLFFPRKDLALVATAFEIILPAIIDLVKELEEAKELTNEDKLRKAMDYAMPIVNELAPTAKPAQRELIARGAVEAALVLIREGKKTRV